VYRQQLAAMCVLVLHVVHRNVQLPAAAVTQTVHSRCLAIQFLAEAGCVHGLVIHRSCCTPPAYLHVIYVQLVILTTRYSITAGR
jgi:hypothetical protein